MLRDRARFGAIVRDDDRRFRPENGVGRPGGAPKAQQEIFEIQKFFRGSKLDCSMESAIPLSDVDKCCAFGALSRTAAGEDVRHTCSNPADQ
jgi:hypothetical protein